MISQPVGSRCIHVNLLVEVGVQASSDMVDASTEPREEALVEARERKKEGMRTEKEKEEGAKDSGLEK